MVKIGVAGILGKMGQTILRCALTTDNVTVISVTEHPQNPKIGARVKEVLGVECDAKILRSFYEGEKPDVIIDFTTPSATLENLRYCLDVKTPIVIGTTGFNKNEKASIFEASRKIPIVFSPNMSLGVNILFELVEKVAEVLGDDYDIEIVEVHHRFKKDSPSGTAMKLAEIVAKATNRSLEDSLVTGRKGIVGERNRREIGVFAVRAGDVVGEHTVIFGGLGERLELTHRAYSRETFARGAIKAAKWIIDKEPGLYSMFDVLGIQKNKR
ncbi:MAG: 4-hydroxy-tetrahydrodipicolinate reductase [Thermosulfidibacteraceae bacterium]|jgi:4-hydroxy-tetrahydrodipicolinate reductase